MDIIDNNSNPEHNSLYHNSDIHIPYIFKSLNISEYVYE